MLLPLEFTNNHAAQTLDAATPLELCGATGVLIGHGDMVSFTLTNPGANPITALAAYWSDDPTLTDWSPADGGISIPGGSLAAGATMRVERAVSAIAMRVIATSADGSSCKLHVSLARGAG